ncbi:MAG: hypothetical protein RL563_2108 [Pseudomonadota bacterium]|jgi:multidrug efflux system membrane fusion protein
MGHQTRKLTTIATQPARLNLVDRKPSIYLIATLTLLTVSGCETHQQQPPPMPEPSVKIAQALNQTITEWDEYTGHLEAVNAVEIRARVGGYLEKIHFVAGAKVKQGDLLFEIDPKPYKAQLNFAQAELERAQSKLALAKNDLARAEGLLRAKAIATEEYDARHKGLREATAAVASAEANVYAAKLNLEYTHIRAPISGRIGREMVTVGNLINAGAESSPLTSIVSVDPIYATVDIDERALLNYRRRLLKEGSQPSDLKGTPLQLGLADEANFPHRGQVDYVAPKANAGTGTISLRGLFSNDDEILSPGFFARVRIQGSEAHAALLLPERALGTDLAQRFVWVVTADNQLEYRSVTPGTHVGPLRVIKEGLKADDWVVIEGLQKLKAGMHVKPERVQIDPAPGN